MKRNLTCLTAFFLACALALAFFTGVVYQKSLLIDAAEHKTIYLTFDDGPSSSVTPVILDILKEESVKATFFLVGQAAKSRPELVRRMQEEGHAIGIHSYTHAYDDIYASAEALLNDIRACSDVIEQIVGIRSKLYRFPGGSFQKAQSLLSAVTKAGYHYVDWNALCGDEEIYQANAAQLYRESVRTAGNRKTVVLLCHDSPHHMQTAIALPDIIHHFKESGYRFSVWDSQNLP